MKQEQQQVKDWMVEAGQETPHKPTMPSRDVRELRIKLIMEEMLELAKAFDVGVEISSDEISANCFDDRCNMVDAYDGILDLLVVVLGAGVAMGVDVVPGFAEVMRSNFSKFIDGHRREDGKFIKGPSYSPANLAPILAAQSSRANVTMEIVPSGTFTSALRTWNELIRSFVETSAQRALVAETFERAAKMVEGRKSTLGLLAPVSKSYICACDEIATFLRAESERALRGERGGDVVTKTNERNGPIVGGDTTEFCSQCGACTDGRVCPECEDKARIA